MKNNTRYALFALGFFCQLVACKQGDVHTGIETHHTVEPTLTATSPRLRLLTPAQTGIDFTNQIVETDENNITTNINTYNGGGLAVGDFNNDGLPDVYFVCSNGKNRLYQNLGGLQFRDVTETAGVGSEDGFETAATAVDVNGDGWLDIYVCRGGVEKNDTRRNRLFINNQNLTFTERAKEYGLDDMSACTGAAFLDYDLDGDLDCYLLNYPTEAVWTNKIEAKLGPDNKYKPFLEPRAEFDSDRFYRNDQGHFVDVSKQAGVWNLAYGLSVSVSDFNRDGWPDVYVGNDFIQPDRLYINNRKGGFEDRLGDFFQHTSQHTMGTDLTDFDNDGLVDLLAMDMLPANNHRRKTLLSTNSQSKQTALMQNGYFEPVVRNVLQRNNGNGTFSDIGCLAGVYQTDWSWSGLMFDIDNDGLKDMHITNGYRREVADRDFTDFVLPEIRKKASGKTKLSEVYPNVEEFLNQIPSFKPRNFCYQNKGDWTFGDMGGQWITLPGSWSCGSAWTDLDADGDLDLAVNNLEDPAFVYENTSRSPSGNQPNSNFLQIKLQGNAPNPFGVGASVILHTGSAIQYAEMCPTRGIFSSVEHLFHFGLGNIGQVDALTIRWPDGTTQTLSNLPANQRLTLKQSEASGHTASICPEAPSAPLFLEKTAASGVNFQHLEDEFNDFENFPMNPWKETDLGPLIAKGDVNGDGLEDFFIANAFDQSSALYAQQANGTFKPISSPTWVQDKIYEDHGAVFLDADGDGDLDLFVVSGGAEATSAQAWQSRMYYNMDGKGTFVKSNGIIPGFNDVCLRAVAHDYDGDGDQDLFIGGRVTPGKWPLTPRSVVLRNDRTRFIDVTAQVAPEFERCGMVTDLAWVNVDGDPQPELVVTGEWMPVMVFKMSNGILQNITAQSGLERSNGLWHRLAVADLDQDGDLDMVTGNFGLNTRLTASAEAPLRCYAKDFDNNGTLDPIMTCFEGNKEFPLMQKEVLNKQMPILKKKLLYAKNYGDATIDQVWPQKDLDAALRLDCYTLATCWWENQNGKFIRHDLPVQAQTSVVQGIIIDDLNGDGYPDLLLAGNKYGLEVETNRCDASNGAFFAGEGKGKFHWVNNRESGFWAGRQVRDLALLRGAGNKRTVVVANNGSGAQIFAPR